MAVQFHDAGHGYDEFGLSPRAVARVAAVLQPFYERYFRVDSAGAESIPASGGAIIVANHAGVLPVDALMLWMDVLRHSDRVLRPVADRFVPRLPFFGELFARAGVVGGALGNVRRLLEAGEVLGIWPEGVTGVAKPFSRRYQLQAWRVGHAELAMRHRVPVIPVAIIGSEESWPLVARLRRLHVFGAPYLPIPMSPVPLPVRYHIRYGDPLLLHEHQPAGAADDPCAVIEAADRTRQAVEELIGEGLAARRSLLS